MKIINYDEKSSESSDPLQISNSDSQEVEDGEEKPEEHRKSVAALGATSSSLSGSSSFSSSGKYSERHWQVYKKWFGEDDVDVPGSKKPPQMPKSGDDEEQGKSVVALGATSSSSAAASSSDGNKLVAESKKIHQQIYAALFGDADLPDNMTKFVRKQMEIYYKAQLELQMLKSGGPSRLGGSYEHFNSFVLPRKGYSDEPGPDLFGSDPYLFQVLVTNSNRLPIPYDLAADYFPAVPRSSPNRIQEHPLVVTHPENTLRNLTYVCFHSDESFILKEGWPEYSAHFGLRPMDAIRFVRPVTASAHFLLEHHPNTDPLPDANPPRFLNSNFLFEMRLTGGDAGFGRLVIPSGLVSFYLPGLGAWPGAERKQDMVRLTDGKDKDWYLLVVYSGGVRQYMVLDGWEVFAREHGLEGGDWIRFYRPDFRAHEKHFLVQIVKREEKEERDRKEEESAIVRGSVGFKDRKGKKKAAEW